MHDLKMTNICIFDSIFGIILVYLLGCHKMSTLEIGRSRQEIEWFLNEKSIVQLFQYISVQESTVNGSLKNENIISRHEQQEITQTRVQVEANGVVHKALLKDCSVAKMRTFKDILSTLDVSNDANKEMALKIKEFLGMMKTRMLQMHTL